MKHNICKALILFLAINFFAYEVELFDNEYQDNHRVVSTTLSYAPPSVTWETFDKSNAPKAFVLNVDVTIELLGYLRLPNIRITPPLLRFDVIRDKSPPSILPISPAQA